MNKKTVNDLIPYAYEALRESGIAEHGRIDKKYRGQISSFGAAITMGSLLSAIAFFSDKGSEEVEEEVDRQKLMDAILYILKNHKKCGDDIKKLYEYVNKQKNNSSNYKAQEDIINAAISLKLAMNLYTLE